MRANRSTWEILGSLLGLVILIVILNAAVGYYRQGSTDFAEQARVAGRPLTLTEVLSGDTGATEEITGTEGLTGTTEMTDSVGVTATTNLTATEATTDTAAIDTDTAMTATTDVTETAPVTISSDLTVTQTTTTTTAVTASTTISEEVEDATEPVATTNVVVTTTNEITATDDLTATSGVSSTEATTSPAEAPAELATVFVKAGCIGCHVIPGVENAVGMIGPDLTNIGIDGATRVEGMSSEEYIRQSLLEPNAVIAPACPTGPCIPNLMVQNLGEILTAEEIDAVVAYLSVQGTTAP